MSYYTLNELIDNTIRLGYGISFDIFGKQLRLTIFKDAFEDSNLIKIQQIVPLNHLTNINKMTNLVNFMLDKIGLIQEDRINEINRTSNKN